MKNGKRPTRAQKILMKDAYGLKPEHFLVVKATTGCIEVMNRQTGKTRQLPALAK